MEGGIGDRQTDASPIQPVSSLRSRFENLNRADVNVKSNGSSTRPQVGPKPGTLSKPSVNALPVEPARRSLDVRTRAASSEAPIPPRLAQNGGFQEDRALHTPRRSRPVSMLNMSPSQSPPRVQVSSPKSPPRMSEVSSSSAVAQGPGFAPRLGPKPPSPRIRGRSGKSSPDANVSSLHLQSPVVHRSAEPSKKSAPVPPPINRTAKPSISFEAATPKQPSRSTDRKISPFNTPPSSEDSSPRHEMPPPVPIQSKPNVVKPPGSSRPVVETPPAMPPRRSRSPSSSGIGRTFSVSEPELHVDHSIVHPAASSRAKTRHSTEEAAHAPTSATTKTSALMQGFSSKRTEKNAEPATTVQENPASRDRRESLPSQTAQVALSTPHQSRVGTPQRGIAPPPRPLETSKHARAGEPTRKEAEAAYNPALFDAGQPLPSNPSFPDISYANRRFPRFEDGPRSIALGHDLRLLDVCGEFICATGPVTRVWNLLDGRLVLSVVHAETVKVTAVSFKPSRKIDDESSKIWLGTNWGELLEVDTRSKKVITTNQQAHSRREVVAIHRHAASLWTLDDDGRLIVWPADQQGSPSLSSPVENARLARGHTASIVVDDELWLASGKEIRVFRPSEDPQGTTSQVTLHALTQASTGSITCCAVVPNRPSEICFGHSDGKVTVYGRESYECVGVVSLSQWKVNCLAGVGDCLWAGFSTGMMHVYDTRKATWRLKKEWRAHENPIVGIVADHSSIWKLDRLQVVSLGTDNGLNIWDGILEQDCIADDVQAHEDEWCRFRTINAKVLTWNVGAAKPGDLKYDSGGGDLFQNWIMQGERPDILVFGLQELVDLEDKKLTAKSFFKSSNKPKDAYGQEHLSSVYRAWRDYLADCLDAATGAEEPYTLLHTASLVGLFSCVFVRGAVRSRVRDVQAAQIKLGMGGIYGNKGALVVRFTVDDTSVCLVNCHLAAGQTQTSSRNENVATILETAPLPAAREAPENGAFVGGGDGSMILDHEICVWNGDLNYRIDTMARDTIVAAVRTGKYGKLLERDQLSLSQKRNPGFRLRAFREQIIHFAPTYKYDVGTDDYDTSEKRRSPAYCDRLLYRGCGGCVAQVSYQRHEVRVSDHRPVSGDFKLRTKTVNAAEQLASRRRAIAAFRELKREVAERAKLDYLTRIFGLSEQQARSQLSR